MDGKQEPDAFQPAGETVTDVARALAAVGLRAQCLD